jgi:predicted acetylornithine/succinylornithine family transaminase
MSVIIEKTDDHIFQTYGRFPIAFVRGEGAYLWDGDGKRYLDFLSGIAVCNLGHCHPAVVKAAREQLERLIHVSNFFYTEPQADLARQLTEHCFAERVFFCNSGAEANEAALKLARKYGNAADGKPRNEIITMQASFHGRTFATLAATGQAKVQEGFAPLMPGFVYVPFNDFDALKAAVNERTCAVMLEPIQGEGGVNVPAPEYLQRVRELCDTEGMLLIFDEVQVGMGRTGVLFAHEHYGVTPDIMTLAKALGGGLPLGAMLATQSAAQHLTAGSHASTFGGNPVATAAGCAVMHELLSGGVLENCRMMGHYLEKKLDALKNRHSSTVLSVRGKGLIQGLKLNRDGAPVVQECLAAGLIVNCTAGSIIRFLPPLIVTQKQIDECCSVLDDVLGRLD